MTTVRRKHPGDLVDPTAIASRLREDGHTVGKTRTAILEAVRAKQQACTAEELAESLGETHVSTVYRTLGLLEEIGVVRHIHLSHRHLDLRAHGRVEQRPAPGVRVVRPSRRRAASSVRHCPTHARTRLRLRARRLAFRDRRSLQSLRRTRLKRAQGVAAAIAAAVGMPPRAPTSVTDNDAAVTATGTASASASPAANRAASTPLKVSPAPVVSRTSTRGALTCVDFPSASTNSTPSPAGSPPPDCGCGPRSAPHHRPGAPSAPSDVPNSARRIAEASDSSGVTIGPSRNNSATVCGTSAGLTTHDTRHARGLHRRHHGIGRDLGAHQHAARCGQERAQTLPDLIHGDHRVRPASDRDLVLPVVVDHDQGDAGRLAREHSDPGRVDTLRRQFGHRCVPVSSAPTAPTIRTSAPARAAATAAFAPLPPPYVCTPPPITVSPGPGSRDVTTTRSTLIAPTTITVAFCGSSPVTRRTLLTDPAGHRAAETSTRASLKLAPPARSAR